MSNAYYEIELVAGEAKIKLESLDKKRVVAVIAQLIEEREGVLEGEIGNLKVLTTRYLEPPIQL